MDDAQCYAENGDGHEIHGTPRGGSFCRQLCPHRPGGSSHVNSCGLPDCSGFLREVAAGTAVATGDSRLPTPVLTGSGSRVCGSPHSQRNCAPLSYPANITDCGSSVHLEYDLPNGWDLLLRWIFFSKSFYLLPIFTTFSLTTITSKLG